jgi:hypothetical protein
MKYYAGIGSRETPPEVLREMEALAQSCAMMGYTLRSGGADGADSAFETGCDLIAAGAPKEIFLPWRGFNKNQSPLFEIPEKAFEISSQHHPRWQYLREPVRKLMARNAQQVLGKNLDTPVEFVICWTPDGCTKGEERTKDTGGTGQAIAIASAHNIPVFNMKRGIIEIEMIYEFIGR